MKNLTKLGLLIFIMVVTLMSCEKTEDLAETKKPDGKALKDYIKNKREAKNQKFTISMDNAAGSEIVGEQGTVVKFFPSQLKDQQGNIVTGNIDVQLLEIYSKADMLFMNKTTMGLLPNGKHAMLVSGGEILLNAYQDGKELVINGSLTVLFPVDNTGGADVDMQLFVNDPLNDCDEAIVCPDDVWVLENDTTNPAGQGGLFIEQIGSDNYYYALVSDFGWTNVDKFYSFTGPKTTLLVDAPIGYNQSNCAIYLSYDGEESGLASLDQYLPTVDLFTEHYGEIPVGLAVHLIIVSIIDGDYSYSIKAATIAEGATIVLDDLVPTTEAALKTAIENLP